VSGDWNAAAYDRVADPQAAWGATVLERLPLAGHETVLDAGCGSGRVTELLIQRLPEGRVIALDASGSMLAEARRRLARFGDRVSFVEADLARPLPIEPVDAILSTATFHWVLDHDALFANLAAVLRPGGWLVAQCGGAGNVANFLEAARRIDPSFERHHNFQTAETTRERLERSGFVDIETWLSPEPTRFAPGEPFETFLETVCLRPNLAAMPAAERRPFVEAVAREMGEPVLDYVRLNIVARRGATA
jgi:trans-aconitate 2-methyltransferase